MPAASTGAPLRAAVFALSLAAHAVCVSALAAPRQESAHDHDAHAGHRHDASASSQLARTEAAYSLPNVSLVRHDGRKVDLARELDDGKPVFLNFIYTTCTAICPPMSQVFSQFQKKLGAERDQVRMVSVSIDPEQDTPKRLDEYARRFDAGSQWVFYTGSVESSIAVQKAFSAYRGDKMNHTPLTLVRPAPGKPWVRLDGFATSEQLLEEFRRASAAK